MTDRTDQGGSDANPLAEWLLEHDAVTGAGTDRPWGGDERPGDGDERSWDGDERPRDVEEAPESGRQTRPDDAEAQPFRPVTLPWGSDEAPTPRRRLLIGLAIAPWLVTALLAGVVVVGEERTPTDRAGPAAGSDQGWRAAAVATAAVHEHVTAADAAASRFVVHAATEAVRPAGDGLVATVTTVVLEGDEQWDRTRTTRYAVPLRTDGREVRTAGAPWPLPAPVGAAAPRWEPVEGDRRTIRAALTAAAYTDVEVADVTRSAAMTGVVRVEVEATAPDEDHPRTHEIWLSDTDPPRILGLDETFPTGNGKERP
jgi:hypothetical protein